MEVLTVLQIVHFISSSSSFYLRLIQEFLKGKYEGLQNPGYIHVKFNVNFPRAYPHSPAPNCRLRGVPPLNFKHAFGFTEYNPQTTYF